MGLLGGGGGLTQNCHFTTTSAVSHDTYFKMADNTLSDSHSSWEERADDGPINSIAEYSHPYS